MRPRLGRAGSRRLAQGRELLTRQGAGARAANCLLVPFTVESNLRPSDKVEQKYPTMHADQLALPIGRHSRAGRMVPGLSCFASLLVIDNKQARYQREISMQMQALLVMHLVFMLPCQPLFMNANSPQAVCRAARLHAGGCARRRRANVGSLGGCGLVDTAVGLPLGLTCRGAVGQCAAPQAAPNWQPGLWCDFGDVL